MPRDARHDEYYEANRSHWDESTRVHEQSRFYDRDGFIAGAPALTPVERAELAPLVAGKRLLHLQCHFGMDTLDLARHGAVVTGLDFSPESIAAARRLATNSGIPGRFIEANVYDTPEVLGERFDVVYSGVGSLNWPPDVEAWARVVARCLEPGGFVYLYDSHPMRGTLSYDREDQLFVVEWPYFDAGDPIRSEDESTYTDGPPVSRHSSYEWPHALGEIVTAILAAGLRLEFLHEHREVAWPWLPWLEPVAGARLWRLPEGADRLPMMYSLAATKPRD